MKQFPCKALLLAASALGLMAAEPYQTDVEISTVRKVLGEMNPLEHTRGQLRLGYIDLYGFSDPAAEGQNAAALGGHLHLDSKRWHGLMAGIEGYFVANLGDSAKEAQTMTGFFDEKGDGFVTLSQAFVDGQWGGFEVKAGRQMLDTPHADSDDIRMMPNYFQAVVAHYRGAEEFGLSAGWIDRMAGWENNADAKSFVPVEKVLGAEKKTDGALFLSAYYDGFEDLSVQAWFYALSQIADILYLEAGHEVSWKAWTFTTGVQFDAGEESGAALLGPVDARTLGVSFQTDCDANGWSLLAAYNRELGEHGALGSLGGGPFFTSMEFLTMDAVGTKGEAWMAGVGYDFSHLGLHGLRGGAAVGRFVADERARFDATEVDLTFKYDFHERLSAHVAYADVQEKSGPDGDFRQIRLFLNANFSS